MSTKTPKPATSPFNMHAHFEVWFRNLRWRVTGAPIWCPITKRVEMRLCRTKANGKLQRTTANARTLQGID